jgi:secreted Zn-dependent insulinase-like peptidase
MDPVMFQELRSKQQLGYVVNAFSRTTNGYPSLILAVGRAGRETRVKEREGVLCF